LYKLMDMFQQRGYQPRIFSDYFICDGRSYSCNVFGFLTNRFGERVQLPSPRHGAAQGAFTSGQSSSFGDLDFGEQMTRRNEFGEVNM